MSKAEDLIKQKTRYNSNQVVIDENCVGSDLWLTPDDAKEVAKIAREEVIEEVCEWLKDAQRFVLQTPQYNYFDYKKAIESLRNTLNK